MLITPTPTRVSFVGGGTDFKEFFSLSGGAVLSTTIDKYLYVIVAVEKTEQSSNSGRFSVNSVSQW